MDDSVDEQSTRRAQGSLGDVPAAPRANDTPGDALFRIDSGEGARTQLHLCVRFRMCRSAAEQSSRRVRARGGELSRRCPSHTGDLVPGDPAPGPGEQARPILLNLRAQPTSRAPSEFAPCAESSHGDVPPTPQGPGIFSLESEWPYISPAVEQSSPRVRAQGGELSRRCPHDF